MRKRDLAVTRRFFMRALHISAWPMPTEVITDRAPAYPRVIEEQVYAARPVTEQYAN
ncbi:MAG: DDE-type integrase/transposase/recombinase [Pseudonocardiaceae bacterium]